jgi:Putative prokaryotic signal transducing protein
MLLEDFSVVYSGTIVQADLLKCLLEGAGVHVVLEDEFIGMIAPYVSPGGAGAVKVLVAKSDMDQARSIVEDFSRKATTKPNLRLVK